MASDAGLVGLLAPALTVHKDKSLHHGISDNYPPANVLLVSA
jgi:hypothetical protein